MGRVMKMEDIQACKVEAGIARGGFLLMRDGMSKENTFVTLADHYGDEQDELIAEILRGLEYWDVKNGEDAKRLFEALCYQKRIGPIDIIAQ